MCLKDDVWNKIFKNAKQGWSSIPVNDHKILACQIHMLTITDHDSASDTESIHKHDDTNVPDATDSTNTCEVNNANAHPGDTHRIMGSNKNTKTKTTGTWSSNMTHLSHASNQALPSSNSLPTPTHSGTDCTMSCREKLVVFIDDKPTFDFGQSGRRSKTMLKTFTLWNLDPNNGVNPQTRRKNVQIFNGAIACSHH